LEFLKTKDKGVRERSVLYGINEHRKKLIW